MLQLATVEPLTLGLLKSLMDKKYVNQYVLVGGTALALQIGHRKSIDLDLFSITDIETETLLENLQKDYKITPRVKTKGSLIGDIEDIKVDFIRFKYQFQHPIKIIDGIRLVGIEDIAPMKIDAIAGRGSKKDFYDLYFLLEHFSLEEILGFYEKMFQHSTIFHVIKSLTWFADADPQTTPDVLNKKVTWEKVKKRIQQSLVGL